MGRIATAIELLAVYGCVLLYIWRWHRSHPLAWIPILAFIILTHVLHRDTLCEMGVTTHQMGANAKIILPLAALIYGLVVVWALSSHRLALPWPRGAAEGRVGVYVIWCCFQQYLMQSYFYRRLTAVLHSPHLSAAFAALMFSGAHVPNLVLMAATVAGGFILSEVFACHPNIWPLALTQAVGGLLIAAVFPASLIHQMRVGPGYYTH
ncbi:MAG: CPBP family glutamic-type intramembrane protease [Terriglobia bacterium]